MVRALQFEAWITTPGTSRPNKHAAEFGIEIDEEGKKVLCWIPSEVGVHFAVNWRNLSYNEASTGDVMVDGFPTGGRLLRRNMKATAVQNALITSPTSSRPFMFSSIDLTDDDTFRHSSDAKDIGEIVLVIRQALEEGVTNHPKQEIPDGGKIHERDTKAITHRVGFGDAKIVPHPFLTSGVQRKKTLATFIFKYRPYQVLLALGVTGKKRKLVKQEEVLDIKPMIKKREFSDDEVEIVEDVQPIAKRMKRESSPVELESNDNSQLASSSRVKLEAMKSETKSDTQIVKRESPMVNLESHEDTIMALSNIVKREAAEVKTETQNAHQASIKM
ncbi:hypothetical protein BDQ12DRAFT_686421 [Crucibulum laeve]|uniref:DUF7918 domain-containing protein n=1 Tax=Crucibulum laeve TaxID=68775 RepID=A0A5C3LVH8_9AGAR|nr:hypothetical protein BDQ12DRAFT_686421 [Crucibulum laeve]